MASHTWSSVKHALQGMTGHVFERAVLPYLRIKWRDLAHAATLDQLDKSGIDLVWFGTGQPLEVVVQCKTYAPDTQLGKPQLQKIDDSIAKFVHSGLRCKRYVLVHNREGRNRTFAAAVEAKLKLLVDGGSAQSAELWDLDHFIVEVDRALAQRVSDEINRRASQHKAHQVAHFLFQDLIVAQVPFVQGDLVMRAHERPHVDLSPEAEVADPVRALTENDKAGHWTLIMGTFGSGKSTLAWRLWEESQHNLLYIPAAALAAAGRGPGENLFVRDLVEYLGIFDDAAEFSEEDRVALTRLAAPLLAARLRDQDTKFVLLIDGLDENRFYGSMAGLHVLKNELQRASCPVILTTRREHFEAHYASYAEQLAEVSRFSKRDRRIRLLELRGWTCQTASAYVTKAIGRASPAQAGHLRELLKQTSSPAWTAQYPLNHPLLLAMAVDLVAEQGMSTFDTRTALYERWIDRKLVRDFLVPRATPQNLSNLDELCWQVKLLMGEVAYAMTARGDDRIELVETIQESTVRELAHRRFNSSVPSELYAVSSLLEPIGPRRTTGMTLRFFHRSFQEYFLAAELVRRGDSVDGFPLSVGEFAENIDRAS